MSGISQKGSRLRCRLPLTISEVSQVIRLRESKSQVLNHRLLKIRFFFF